ncbi:transposase family protein [Candidatus Woesearchaeota archaeon]|nr:transposase family protein [Candidatus Woesearchaeota archaeon]
MNKIKCIHCGNKNIIKKGKQKNLREVKQRYYCKDCRKRFVFSWLIGKKYNVSVIINALSYYNLGNNTYQSSKLVNRQFKVKVSNSIVCVWINEFKRLCPYYKIRDKVINEYGKNIIASKLFKHNGLTYNYKYHKAKIDFLDKEFNELVKYLKRIEEDFPHEFFDINKRCSQLKMKLDGIENIDRKKSYASDLARFSVGAARNDYLRHKVIEEFMLINDVCTVAIEVPIWFWDKRWKKGICGHIDIIQTRGNKIHILDYKPNAISENLSKVCSQLFFYAKGISFRTGIKLKDIRCAWFDDKDYFEFQPEKIFRKSE